MPVVKLDTSHAESLKHLFESDRYMGTQLSEFGFALNSDVAKNRLFNIFCSNYLSGLNSNFHAYGYEHAGVITALISFYESVEEPAWYYTLYRASGESGHLSAVLDTVIDHNEANGRLKFYTLVNSKHSKLLRRFHWSAKNNERYGYVDEYVVPAKTKCYYVNAWELLFKRVLLPVDTVVRCNYLKQEYRDTIHIGGNI